jgi:alkylhydroperoxidase family enzyme
MPRVEPLHAPYPEHVQAFFERIMPAGRDPLVLFRTLATSERAFHKFRAASLLSPGPLTLRQRELVIDRTCARAGCEYEWGVHVAFFAGPAGLSADDVAATLEVPARLERWTASEAALIATVDALHERACLSDAEFARLRCFYDEAQVLEVLMLAGFYRTVAYIANGLGLPLEPDAPRFPTAG